MTDPASRLQDSDDTQAGLRLIPWEGPIERPSGPVDPIEDYYQLATHFDWPLLLEGVASRSGTILDVGSGTGRWLRVLAQVWPEISALKTSLHYSSLDPSPGVGSKAHDAAGAFAELDTHYTATIQHANELPVDYFDLIWAMHSLYSLDPSDIPKALDNFMRSLAPGGVALIALSDTTSFYAQACVELTADIRFLLADDVLDAVRKAGLSHRVDTVSYNEVIPAEDDEALRRYLWHESIGNTYTPAGGSAGDQLPELPKTPWWESFRQGANFVFHQRVPVVSMYRP